MLVVSQQCFNTKQCKYTIKCQIVATFEADDQMGKLTLHLADLTSYGQLCLSLLQDNFTSRPYFTTSFLVKSYMTYEELTFSVEISNLLRAYLQCWTNHYCRNDEEQTIKWSNELKTNIDSQNNTQRTKDWAAGTSLKSRGWTHVLRKG